MHLTIHFQCGTLNLWYIHYVPWYHRYPSKPHVSFRILLERLPESVTQCHLRLSAGPGLCLQNATGAADTWRVTLEQHSHRLRLDHRHLKCKGRTVCRQDESTGGGDYISGISVLIFCWIWPLIPIMIWLSESLTSRQRYETAILVLCMRPFGCFHRFFRQYTSESNAFGCMIISADKGEAEDKSETQLKRSCLSFDVSTDTEGLFNVRRVLNCNFTDV